MAVLVVGRGGAVSDLLTSMSEGSHSDRTLGLCSSLPHGAGYQ